MVCNRVQQLYSQVGKLLSKKIHDVGVLVRNRKNNKSQQLAFLTRGQDLVFTQWIFAIMPVEIFSFALPSNDLAASHLRIQLREFLPETIRVLSDFNTCGLVFTGCRNVEYQIRQARRVRRQSSVAQVFAHP